MLEYIGHKLKIVTTYVIFIMVNFTQLIFEDCSLDFCQTLVFIANVLVIVDQLL